MRVLFEQLTWKMFHSVTRFSIMKFHENIYGNIISRKDIMKASRYVQNKGGTAEDKISSFHFHVGKHSYFHLNRRFISGFMAYILHICDKKKKSSYYEK